MLLRISRYSKRIVAVLSQHRTPTQIAGGIAIGITFGLIPKDNLVALTLIASVALFRVNQLVACCTACGIGLLSGWFGPMTGYVGSLLLDQTAVSGSIVYVYRFPIIPWTCLENALVLGGIAVGLATLLPTYAVFWWGLSKAKQQLESVALEQVVNDAIQYRKTVADQSKMRLEKPAPQLKLISNPQVTSDLPPSATANSTATKTPNSKITSLPDPNQNSRSQPNILPISNAFSQDSLLGQDRKIHHRTIPTVFRGEVSSDGNDTFLRETIIEVVRYRSPKQVVKVPTANDQDLIASPQPQGTPMPAGIASAVPSHVENKKSFENSTSGVVAGQSLVFDAGHAPAHASNRDESLKYLLWHINGSRENVRKSSEKNA